MPLHLLHHKSYHVYSAENIARVRRDEADAAAHVAAEDARMQAADAEARIRILRERASQGDLVVATEEKPEHGAEEPAARHIKARDLRRQPLEGGILGADGHINLFPTPTAPQGGDLEREGDKGEEKRWEEGAMGKVVGERWPWYSSVDLVSGQLREKEKDGRRTEWEGKREERRKEAGDPLGVIKSGVWGVKEARREREEWNRREREAGGAGARGWPDEQDEWDGMTKRSRRGDRGGRDGDRKRKRRRRSRSRGRSPSRHDTSHKRYSQSHSDSHPRSCRHKHRRDDSDRHHRHHNHHPHSHHRRSRSNSRPRSKSPNSTLELLRNEKSQRESAERQKAALLLAKVQADSEPGWKPAPGGRYSSQFGHRPGYRSVPSSSYGR